MACDAEATLASLRAALLAFRDEREWAPFHQPKDLALALSVEAAELLAEFRFRTDQEVRDEVAAGASNLPHELADVLAWLLVLSHELGVDLASALEAKMAITARRYPVHLARGRREKYTRLPAPEVEGPGEEPAP